MSVYEIEDAVGVGHTTIDKIAREFGIHQPKSERRRLRAAPAEVRKQIVEQYKAGSSITSVARTLDVSPDIVYGEIKRRGVVRNRT